MSFLVKCFSWRIFSPSQSYVCICGGGSTDGKQRMYVLEMKYRTCCTILMLLLFFSRVLQFHGDQRFNLAERSQLRILPPDPFAVRWVHVLPYRAQSGSSEGRNPHCRHGRGIKYKNPVFRKTTEAKCTHQLAPIFTNSLPVWVGVWTSWILTKVCRFSPSSIPSTVMLQAKLPL